MNWRAAFLLVLLPLAWWMRPTSAGPIDNVVLITLDTTRADHLGAYGSHLAKTPALDRLSREGVVFENAFSPVPLTLPAHTSLLTGLLPPRHGVRDNADAPLGRNHATLAEILRSCGFETAAFVGSAILQKARGLARGFETYGDVRANAGLPQTRVERPATEVVNEALGWLRAHHSRRLFVWIHLYDPHAPYQPPEPYRTWYANDLYSGEIAFADEQIGRVIDALDHWRLLDRSAVIVAADHGEALGEHGERGHGTFVYRNVTHVPLIMRMPAIAAGRIAATARLVDVMPTVLDALHVAVPPVDGVSLVAALEGREKPPGLGVYAESLYPQRFGCSPSFAFGDDRFEFIDAPRPELYDVRADPSQLRNLYDERPSLAHTLAERLWQYQAAQGKAPESVEPGTPDNVVSGQLRALGYVAGTARVAPARTIAAPDSKDCIGRIESLTAGALPAHSPAPLPFTVGTSRRRRR